jgi:hypothetical protein
MLEISRIGETVNRKAKIWIRALVAALALITVLSGTPAQGDGDPCVDPNNLTQNCQFSSFAGGGVPAGWTRFDEVGNPAFDQSHDTPFDGISLRIWSDWVPFTSGIYQQVPNVTPGTAYVAAIGWAPATTNWERQEGNIERMLGIDPLGGTDSTSPNVVWGPVYSGKSRAPDLQVSAVAQNTTITVFVRVRVGQSHGVEQAFLDAVGLKPDPNQPTPTDTPIPTDTPVPPTDTPVPPTDTPVPPTDTPVPTDTPLPTEMPTPEPTATPTHTPIPPATAVALANDPSPRPKATAKPKAAPAPESRLQATDLVPYMFLFAGFASFGGAAVMVGLMVWLWRSGKGDSQKD